MNIIYTFKDKTISLKEIWECYKEIRESNRRFLLKRKSFIREDFIYLNKKQRTRRSKEYHNMINDYLAETLIAHPMIDFQNRCKRYEKGVAPIYVFLEKYKLSPEFFKIRKKFFDFLYESGFNLNHVKYIKKTTEREKEGQSFYAWKPSDLCDLDIDIPPFEIFDYDKEKYRKQGFRIEKRFRYKDKKDYLAISFIRNIDLESILDFWKDTSLGAERSKESIIIGPGLFPTAKFGRCRVLIDPVFEESFLNEFFQYLNSIPQKL